MEREEEVGSTRASHFSFFFLLSQSARSSNQNVALQPSSLCLAPLEPSEEPRSLPPTTMADQALLAKRISGTNALVDGFRFQSPEFQTYFLTHAHSDHTTGETEREKEGLER